MILLIASSVDSMEHVLERYDALAARALPVRIVDAHGLRLRPNDHREITGADEQVLNIATQLILQVQLRELPLLILEHRDAVVFFGIRRY